MLADPLPIKYVALSGHAAVTVAQTNNFPRVDSGDGSARYELPDYTLSGACQANGVATIKIAHTKSNENKPFKTSRTLLRLDFPVMGPDREVLNAYCYAVFGCPDTTMLDAADGTTLVTPTELYVGLANFLFSALAVSSTAATLDETKIARILAGES